LLATSIFPYLQIAIDDNELNVAGSPNSYQWLSAASFLASICEFFYSNFVICSEKEIRLIYKRENMVKEGKMVVLHCCL